MPYPCVLGWSREHQVLVDPPRAGLDSVTLSLLRNFDFVVYISCNPESLVRDLRALCFSSGTETPAYEVRRMAVFDHFAYSTDHLESAVLLVRG
jgi:tRNA (uracil-5-)-methyltransferase